MKKKFYNTTTFHLLKAFLQIVVLSQFTVSVIFFNDFLNKNKLTCLFSTDPRFNLFQPLKKLRNNISYGDL